MPAARVLLVLCALAAGAPDVAVATGPSLRGDVRYEVSGGFAGLDDRLLLRADGRARLTRRAGKPRRFRVSARDRRALARAFDRAGFASVRSDPEPEGADLLTFRISYLGHSASTNDAVSSSALDPIRRRLDRIVDRGT